MIRLTPARRAASSTATVPRALTRSASSGSACTSLTSATAARWATAPHECRARSSASRSVIDPGPVPPPPRVLPATSLGQPLDLDQAERRGELVHAEVEPRDVVGGLAVIAEGT